MLRPPGRYSTRPQSPRRRHRSGAGGRIEIEWPDKATRDACMAQMEGASKTGEPINPARNPVPFDGMRMI